MPTPTVYPQHKLRQYNGTAVVDWDTDDIRIFILTNTHTDSDAHDFVDDLTNHVTGTGAPGTSGLALTGEAIALDGTTAEMVHDDVTITQSGAGFSNGRYVVWAKWTGTASTSPLIMRMNNGSDFGNVAGDLIIDASAATGVLTVA